MDCTSGRTSWKRRAGQMVHTTGCSLRCCQGVGQQQCTATWQLQLHRLTQGLRGTQQPFGWLSCLWVQRPHSL